MVLRGAETLYLTGCQRVGGATHVGSKERKERKRGIKLRREFGNEWNRDAAEEVRLGRNYAYRA